VKILQLNTGLFPDAQTVEAALRQIASMHHVETVNLRRRDMREGDWDEVMHRILAADQIVSI
jgi:hypothetical protein